MEHKCGDSCYLCKIAHQQALIDELRGLNNDLVKALQEIADFSGLNIKGYKALQKAKAERKEGE